MSNMIRPQEFERVCYNVKKIRNNPNMTDKEKLNKIVIGLYKTKHLLFGNKVPEEDEIIKEIISE